MHTLAVLGHIIAQATPATPAPVVPPKTLPADQVGAFVLFDIAVILVVARLVGGLFVRMKQPRVVGEIIAGVLLGPSLLGATVFHWTKPWGVLACDRALNAAAGAKPPKAGITECFFPPQSQGVLAVIGSLALALFMFLVGMELDPALLKGKLKGIVSVGVGVVALPLAVGALITPLLYNKKFAGVWDPAAARPSKAGFALMVGAMLSVTAFPVAVRILQEKGLASSPMGAVAISAAALVTILMFLVVGVARGVATHATASSQVKRFVGLAILLAVLYGAVRPFLEQRFGAQIRAKGLSGDAFVALVIVMLVCAYAADRIGVNVIVGGFLAGTVMPARDVTAKAMSARLSDITIMILLPVFLAVSGLKTDFTKLGVGWIAGLAVFVLAGVLSKLIGGVLFGRLGGMSAGESRTIAVLMNCRGLLVLVVALVALNAKVISPQLQVGAVLMALISTAMTGPLMDATLRGMPAPAAPAAPESGRPVRRADRDNAAHRRKK